MTGKAGVTYKAAVTYVSNVWLRRLRWMSGRPFADMYDAAPTAGNATEFLRIFNNDLVINCKRCASIIRFRTKGILAW